MNAEVINPWTWQEQYGFVHGVAVPAARGPSTSPARPPWTTRARPRTRAT